MKYSLRDLPGPWCLPPRRRALRVLLVALILGGCGDSATNQGEAPEEIQDWQIVETDPAELDDLPELQEWREAQEAARDTTSSTRPPTTESLQVTSIPGAPSDPPLLPDYRDQVWSQVDSSLLGNSEHAVNIAIVLSRCHGKSLGQDRVTRQLEHMQAREVKPGTRWTYANGVTLVYESYDQFASQLWQLHDQCQSVEGLFGEELRSRIEDLADRGNPEARYLYAMWPPNTVHSATDSGLETLDYHNRALQYTWSNLEEREWLGVMAMGQSYSGRSAANFTPNNSSLGRVFLLAAEICGFENDWLREHNSIFRNRLGARSHQPVLTSFEKDATEIATLFCE